MFVGRHCMTNRMNKTVSTFFSASCDKIAQHDATCTACDKMLPHGKGLDWSPYWGLNWYRRPFQTFPSLAARSPPIQNPDPRKLSGLPTRKFLGKGTCPNPCSVEFPPLCGVSSRIPLWGGRAGTEYFWHFYKVPEQTKQWQRYLKSNGMQATKL